MITGRAVTGPGFAHPAAHFPFQPVKDADSGRIDYP
jgi:hypothetical protein